MKKVVLNGRKLLYQSNDNGEASLIDPRSKKSVAYVYQNGEILSYGRKIGAREDLKVEGEK